MPQLTWLVTGCSSGIGESLVHTILARGDKVIASGRNVAERLAHLKNTGAIILELDVTKSQSEIDAKVAEAVNKSGGIDVLVNNAGYIEAGFVEEVSCERWLTQLNTNLLGTINVTRAVLPTFRKQKSGKIAFIGSFGGWQGDVASGPYSTTKFAIEGLVDVLQRETSHFGIQTIVFELGDYPTKIFSPGNVKATPSTIPDYAELYAAMIAGLQTINGNQRGDIKKCAERIVDVLKSEGMALGREMPKRLPLGPDAMAIIKKKCEETTKICKEWEDIIVSTDLEEKGKKFAEYVVDAKLV